MENSLLHKDGIGIPWMTMSSIYFISYISIFREYKIPRFCDFKQCCNKCSYMDIIAHMCKYVEDKILGVELLDQRVNVFKILINIVKFPSKDVIPIYTSINNG